MESPAARAQKRQALLDKVQDIMPILARDAAAGEAGRTLPADSVEALRNAGLFALKVPECLGGSEADPKLQTEIIEAVCYLDASIGWNVCIGNGAMSLTGYLPDQAIDAMFKNGRIPTAAGVFKPGRAVPAAGGYRVKGRWSWASGVRHAEWVAAHVLVDHGASQPPSSRIVMMPASAITLHDNWHVAGLKGTGSCDFSVNDVFVPEGFTFDLMKLEPQRGGPLYLQGFPGLLINEFMGFYLGVARRAHDELVKVVSAKQRGYGLRASTADRQVVQRAIGLGEMRLRAVRHLLDNVLDAVWAKVCGGQRLEIEDQLVMRGATVLATDTALDLAANACRYGGGEAIFLDHPLQRCLRDVQAGAAHLFVSDAAYELLGKHRLGREIVDPMAG